MPPKQIGIWPEDDTKKQVTRNDASPGNFASYFPKLSSLVLSPVRSMKHNLKQIRGEFNESKEREKHQKQLFHLDGPTPSISRQLHAKQQHKYAVIGRRQGCNSELSGKTYTIWPL